MASLSALNSLKTERNKNYDGTECALSDWSSSESVNAAEDQSGSISEDESVSEN